MAGNSKNASARGRKKVRKVVTEGHRPRSRVVQQHDYYHHRPSGQRYCGLVVGCAGLQGLAQVDSVCCSGSCGRRRQDRDRTWSEERRSSHLGPWSWPRIFRACAQRAWHPCHFHSGCDPDPAQRRPSFQASPASNTPEFFILLNPASVAAC